MSFPPNDVDAARPILLRIDSATVVRPTGEVVFKNLTWTICEGESWAIVGPVGSGKTALTDLLLGRLRVTEGSLSWRLIEQLRTAGRPVAWPSEVIARVAFKEELPLFSYGKHYYQERFNFIEPQDDLTLDEFVHAGMKATEADLAAVTARLGLGELRSLSFIKLSNGQTRRARIARALLTCPEVLVLDEPFVGLDVDGRREVETILRKLIDEGVRLILITSPNSIPDCINHVLELSDRRISYHGPRAGYRAPDVRKENHSTLPTLHGKPIVELRHVNVTYGGKPILNDISWTVRQGERWAVLGPNGSGKTTLLSLICGDHPQAYGNDVSVFGRRRGTGESIWDVKRRIGLVSPEVHLYFSEPLSVERTIATGFFDVLVSRPTTPEQDAAIGRLLDYFEIRDLSDRPFARLSAGQQRIVLLARALVKDPPLLILDEPFQMLDTRTIERAQKWIDELPADQTVLFVTHNEAELPRTITRRLRLKDGAVVELSG
jgi:molybdate transport system ATP-binding protein